MKPRPAICIVDDEKRMCLSLKDLLERRGFDVEIATSGKAALNEINNKDFDLFLLDICIPDLDGFYLMEHIFTHLPEAPVVMMTGDATVDSAIKALRKGAYDYLKKPFEPEDLEKTIENALRQKKLLQENRSMGKRLKISERRYRFMVQNSPDMIYTLDKKGIFTFVNKAAEKLFGYKAKDLIGAHYQVVLFTEDIEKAQWRFNERRTGNRATSGYELRLKSGFKKNNGESNGNGHAVVELNATGIYHQKQTDAPKQLIGTYGVARDITYKKILEAQLLQAKKAEAIGNLAGGIAHDFNNLLMGIQGTASLMIMGMDPNHPLYERIKTLEQYVQDGAGLTRQLLAFVKGEPFEIKPTDINNLITKQNHMFGRTHKEIKIAEDLDPDIWPVEVDPVQIEQVLLNIYVNAGHAMSSGGKLHIRTANKVLAEDEILTLSAQLKPGRYVKISVTDTGVGMDQKTLQRIFDPFFTTKGIGKGCGLGLYCAYGIIKNHGGHVQAISKEGAGTKFSIYIPASQKEIAIAKKPTLKRVAGMETVLLVDDEEKIRNTCKDNLIMLGYTVITADSGIRAVEIYKEKADAIDVVVLDMIMPGLSGKDTYERLKRINPAIKVLLASGYTMEGQAGEILDEGCNAFIQKPFKIEQLSMMIREVMESECLPSSSS
jgi:PAS domain S-box-containing protein